VGWSSLVVIDWIELLDNITSRIMTQRKRKWKRMVMERVIMKGRL
jgi:hypothetical protein